MLRITKQLKTIITIHLLLLLINKYECDESNNNKNIFDLLNPNKILSKSDTTINCLGIPSKLFADLVEKLFTDKTKAKDIRYYFYSRNSDKATVQSGDDFQLEDVNFKINRKTIVIIHGFLSSGKADWVKAMKNQFLKLGDYNVIAVDWQKGSNTFNYYEASISTKIVSQEVAKLFHKIKQKALKISPDLETVGHIYFVGHSLGAHVSGHSSSLIKIKDRNDTSKWVIDRITGLDPAQPCFQSVNPLLKLSKHDANYVDIIHTNARNILLLGFGLPNQIGHMDFYPNGGQVQTGCNDIDVSLWNFLLLPINILKTAVCSHGRAHALFTDTIRVKFSKKCNYRAHPWNRKYENLDKILKANCTGECPEMGIDSLNYHPEKDGTYFLETGHSKPYCVVTKDDKDEIEEQFRRDGNLQSNNLLKFADRVIQ